MSVKHPVIFPTLYHEEDKEFIEGILSSLKPMQRIVASEGYSEVYRKCVEYEKLPHKKHNFARRTCNNRLRCFCSKCCENINC